MPGPRTSRVRKLPCGGCCADVEYKFCPKLLRLIQISRLLLVVGKVDLAEALPKLWNMSRLLQDGSAEEISKMTSSSRPLAVDSETMKPSLPV
jgi:hypothetical protein